VRLATVERLDQRLLAVPSLVESLIAGETLAIEQIADWLKAVEHQLTALQLPAAATFATLRARLWAVTRGLRLPGLQLTKAPSARNWRQVGASAILDEARQTLDALVAAPRAAVMDADNILRQAVELGRVRERIAGQSLPWYAPEELWSALMHDQDLTAFATRAVSLLGEADARTLLARVASEAAITRGASVTSEASKTGEAGVTSEASRANEGRGLPSATPST
jgi:hypothetical protein